MHEVYTLSDMRMSRVRGSRDAFVQVAAPVFLALLVVAGQIKGHPLLLWVPIDLTVLAAVLVLLAFIITRLRFGPGSGWVALPLATWIIVFVPAVALSDLSGYGAEKVAVLFTFTLLLAVAPFQLLRTEAQRRSFLVALVAMGLLATVWALIVRPTTASEWTTRLVLEGTNTIGTARIAMGSAIILVMLALAPHTSSRVRLVAAVCAPAVAFLALLTGSRGPVLGAAGALALTVAFAPLFRRFRGRAIAALIVVVGISAWAAAANGVEGFSRVLAVLLGDSDNSSRTRVLLWERAWGQVVANPWGAGWGGFSGPADINYPHNLLLEVSVETGWFTTILVMVLLVVANVRSLRRATSTVQASFAGLLLFATMNAMVSADINGSRLMWVLLFAAWAIQPPRPRQGQSGTSAGVVARAS